MGEGASPAILIRNESDADIGGIAGVTVAAFKALEISSHTEAPSGIAGGRA